MIPEVDAGPVIAQACVAEQLPNFGRIIDRMHEVEHELIVEVENLKSRTTHSLKSSCPAHFGKTAAITTVFSTEDLLFSRLCSWLCGGAAAGLPGAAAGLAAGAAAGLAAGAAAGVAAGAAVGFAAALAGAVFTGAAWQGCLGSGSV